MDEGLFTGAQAPYCAFTIDKMSFRPTLTINSVEILDSLSQFPYPMAGDADGSSKFSPYA